MASGRVRLARVIGPLSEDPEGNCPIPLLLAFGTSAKPRSLRVRLRAHRFCGVALRSHITGTEVDNLNYPDFGNRLLQLICYQNCVLSFWFIYGSPATC